MERRLSPHGGLNPLVKPYVVPLRIRSFAWGICIDLPIVMELVYKLTLIRGSLGLVQAELWTCPLKLPLNVGASVVLLFGDGNVFLCVHVLTSVRTQVLNTRTQMLLD